jgi:MYXO-CTERM domain-containing protein
MKKLILAAAALMVSIAAYGQGQFVFNNRIPPDINAQFQLGGVATALTGTDYTVELLGGAQGTALSAAQVLGNTSFRTGAAAGYVNPVTVTVPGVAGGKSADIFLEVFKGSTPTGTALGTFGPFTVTVNEAPNPPLNLPVGTSALNVTVPEPATLALGALGLGALLAIRRRK